MIRKNDLLKLLNNALLAEEKSLPIYTKHLETASFWTGLKEDKVKNIRYILNLLSEESKEHVLIIERLINDVMKDERDAF